MTREEAIKSLQNIIEYWTYKPTEVEAVKMAIDALRQVSREQVERVWPGCNRCKDPDTAIAWERWGHQYCSQGSGTVGGCPTGRRKRMGWIRRETEKGTTQYICPNCHDYHEFREDFGEQTFSENFIFCRRCGARNGTGTAPTLTPPNEWVNRVRELDELYTKLQIVTGFTAEQLLEIFAAGYTLEKPDYSKKFAEMENLAEAAQPNEPLTMEELRESPHGKIKNSTLQSICNRANEIASRPPEVSP